MEKNNCLKYIFLATFLSFLHFNQLVAQAIEARISADTTEMLIGDQVDLTISVSHSPNVNVEWPLFVDTLSGLNIVSKTAVETTQTENKVIEYQQLTVTSFDSGYYRIPGIDIPYKVDGSDAPKSTFTNAVSLTVFTIPVDTTQDIKAIKGIIGEPLTFRDVLPYILLGLLAVLVVVGGIWYMRKRKKDEPLIVAKPKPQIPPHEIAMRKLAQLEARKLWQKDDIKNYYGELTDIFREYMENRFHIPAMESVTDEIVADLNKLDLKPIQISASKSLLEMADLAKFAKFKPSQNDNMQSMEVVRDFIKDTKTWVVKEEKEEVIEENSAEENKKETVSESK